MIPLGICRSCTALLVTFRCCPPAPEPRHVAQSRSCSRRTNCVSVGSGKTATVTVLVCTRPLFSVGGIRCQRCPPASSLKTCPACLPSARKTRRPDRRSTISRSKTPLERDLGVDGELLFDQELCIGTAFGGTNLDDESFHCLSFRGRQRSRTPDFYIPIRLATGGSSTATVPSKGRRGAQRRLACFRYTTTPRRMQLGVEPSPLDS